MDSTNSETEDQSPEYRRGYHDGCTDSYMKFKRIEKRKRDERSRIIKMKMRKRRVMAIVHKYRGACIGIGLCRPYTDCCIKRIGTLTHSEGVQVNMANSEDLDTWTRIDKKEVDIEYYPLKKFGLNFSALDNYMGCIRSSIYHNGLERTFQDFILQEAAGNIDSYRSDWPDAETKHRRYLYHLTEAFPLVEIDS